MGCDYYVKTVLKVYYENLPNEKIVLSEERHWWLADLEFDSDDPKEVRDKAIAEYERECEEEMEKHTKNKLLYENKVWLTDMLIRAKWEVCYRKIYYKRLTNPTSNRVDNLQWVSDNEYKEAQFNTQKYLKNKLIQNFSIPQLKHSF